MQKEGRPCGRAASGRVAWREDLKKYAPKSAGKACCRAGFTAAGGCSLVCILFARRTAGGCPASVCTFSQSAAALYTYFLQTKRGCLVYALFGGCGSVPGVCLVYALFRNLPQNRDSLVCILFTDKTGLPSVCTFCRQSLVLWCPASVCTFSFFLPAAAVSG